MLLLADPPWPPPGHKPAIHISTHLAAVENANLLPRHHARAVYRTLGNAPAGRSPMAPPGHKPAIHISTPHGRRERESPATSSCACRASHA
eukprot:365380-Chlamydomonas_euryale.AAC.10